MPAEARRNTRNTVDNTRDIAIDFDRQIKRARQDNSDRTKTYTVVKGDSLSSIASDEGVSMQELYLANPSFDPRREGGVLHFDRRKAGSWDPDHILPGDEINLPIARQAIEEPPAFTPGTPDAKTPDATTPGFRSSPATPSDPANPGDPWLSPWSSTSPRWPGGPTATPAPTVPATPAPPFGPPMPGRTTAPTGTPEATSSQQQDATGWTGLAYPAIRAILPQRAGLGLENTWNRKGNVTIEPYAKAFWQAPKGFGISAKIKWTPRADVAQFSDAPGRLGFRAMFARDKNGNRNWSGLLPQKIGVDAGIVVGNKFEFGRTLEFGKKSVKPTGSFFYSSLKDKNDPLVSTTQVKLGKAQGGALFKGLITSLKTKQKDFWQTARSMEVQVSSEWKPVTVNVLGVESSGLVTVTGKTTLGEAVDNTAKVLTDPPPARTTRFGRAAGFTSGTIASFGGDALARRLGSDRIQSTPLRNAVNASAAATAGVATDLGVTHVVSKVAPKVAPKIAKAAAPLVRATSKVPWGAVGRTAAKAGRIGGPAGALLAGVPDGVNAYKSFKAGDNAAGAASTAKATVKVGATLAGAAIGQALIPIPVVGAAVGAVVGGFVGDALTSGTAMKVYSAVGHGAAEAGQAVANGAGKAAKWVGGLFH